MKDLATEKSAHEWFTPVWVVPLSLLALLSFYVLMR